MCDQTDARTICGRSLEGSRTLLTSLISAQPPRTRAPYKSILCPRTLAAAVAFAARHRLHPDDIALRLANNGPGDLLPLLLSNMNLLNPIYTLDNAFWADMCRLVASALTDALRVLAERRILTRHWHPQQQQGAQQDLDLGPHWTWCEVTLARWRRRNVHHNDADEDEDHVLVEEMDQMLYATTSVRERAGLNEDERTARIAQIRAQLPPLQVLTAAAAAGQRQTPREAELATELFALLQLHNATRPDRNRNGGNNNRRNNSNHPSESMRSFSDTPERDNERQGRGGGGADHGAGQPTLAPGIAAARQRHRDIMMHNLYRNQVHGAALMERINFMAQLDGKETELARQRAALIPNH